MHASTRVLCTEEDLFKLTYTPTTKPSSTKEAGGADKAPQQISADTAKGDGEPEMQNKISNPLNWFGILVPPALKASQAAFQNAITKVPRLAALDLQMRDLEIEIRRTRKKLSKLER